MVPHREACANKRRPESAPDPTKGTNLTTGQKRYVLFLGGASGISETCRTQLGKEKLPVSTPLDRRE